MRSGRGGKRREGEGWSTGGAGAEGARIMIKDNDRAAGGNTEAGRVHG